MSSRIIVEVRQREDLVEAYIRVPGEGRHTVSWSNKHGTLFPSPDLAVPLVLLVAMRLGRDVTIEAPLSSELLGRVDDIQRIYANWDSSLDRVTVDIDGAPPSDGIHPTSASRLGPCAFFSGGVDSFYCALTRRRAIQSLVFVRGFDIGHRRKELLDRVGAANCSAAADLGLSLVDVETDLRDFSHRYLTWSEFHGAAMAATAHVLGCPRIFVPGSLSVGYAHPYGSHPSLDHLFGTARTEIVYDGYDVSRLEKVREIVDSPAALRHLRVCNARDDTGYNCGRCEKCLRTLVSIRVAGIRDALPTFPSSLDLGDVATRRILRVPDLWRQNLVAARSAGNDPALVSALEASLLATTDPRPKQSTLE